MIDILNILESLEATTKRLEKESILQQNINNQLLKDILFLSLDPYTNFGVSKFKKPKKFIDSCDEEKILNEFVYELLPKLAKRDLTGNLAKESVNNIFSRMSSELGKWAERILLRKLRCGVQITTANKIWPNLIQPFEVQLASVLESHCEKGTENIIIDDEIKFPVQCEPKLDGLRCIAIKHNANVELFTRNGTQLETLPRLIKYLESREDLQEVVLDGEGLVLGNWNDSASVLMSRVNNKDDVNMVYNVFDIMTYEQWINKDTKNLTQKVRREFLESLFSKESGESPIKQTTVQICNNFKEVIAFYKKCLDEGFEGIMLKDLNGTYTFDRTSAWRKLKPETTYDGVVVGTYDGNVGSKREGMFGGFYVLLPNGVTTRVGSGMTDVLKAEVNEDRDSYPGKPVEIMGQPPLTSDGKIRFPRFKRFRDSSDIDPKVLEAYDVYVKNNTNIAKV